MSSELDDELLELVGGGDKSSRKRTREGSSSAPGRSSKPPKSSKKRKLADSDNEPESEEGDESDELYPLEGKYIDEEDREVLLSKTEIEREGILATRMDELERIRDRKHVEKLRAQQLAGVAAVESETLKRPSRATGKDKSKDRTLSALKAKRKAKDEKKRTRGSSPKVQGHERSSSPMDMDMSETSSDSEDGQISKLDIEDERLFGKPKPPPTPSEPAVELPLTPEYLGKIAFTRDALAKHAASPWFEKIVAGGWVRYLIGQQETARVYRICQIKSLAPAPKPYQIGDRTMHHVFELRHGKAEKAWQMDHTSNDAWTEDEFKRLVDTCAAQKVPLPSRKEVDERFNDMQELIAKPVTESDISDMISARKALATAPTTMSVAERSRLIAARTLAQRRQDYTEVSEIDAKLAAIAPSAEAVEKEKEDRLEDRLARVNERNRKANMEAVRRAEGLEAERKRRERREKANGRESFVLDPSARLRTVPRLFESATPTSRPSTPNPAALAAQKTAVSPTSSPTPPKANGTTNGKSFEAAVIESIEVDLGDF
ncbi:plus-3-domain-containing protein [Mycena maculata]|uniref:Plus-3-domain-containing protein n=1 Tax=Mycena maculata TaxID=230809 RepID=A0AAD7NN70_9AGAR|nr:plus-3-domain-containing protein [Mycena maculata]